MNTYNIKKYKYLPHILLIWVLIIIAIPNFFFEKKCPENFKYLSVSFTKTIQIIKDYIYPCVNSHSISLNERKKDKIFLNNYYATSELSFKSKLEDIQILRNLELSNGKYLEKLYLKGGFYNGIQNINPGSGYIDIYENNFFILSARGVLAYSKNIEETNALRQIENNINDFINFEHFTKNRWYSIKDMFIYKKKIFVSFTEEIQKECWNTSIIYGDLVYTSVKFKKLFTADECVSSIHSNEFVGNQSGGKIAEYDDDHILFTIGEYRNRDLAQNKNSLNGKVVKIHISNGRVEILSMGHRNPQGIYFDKENDFIIETEHGPKGGDEINLIELSKINIKKIPNYGWPISSAGEHYGGRTKENKKKYEKYPLFKSHIEHGFIEPIKSFVPSIGISEITKIGQDKYVLGSMKDKSLYFFGLNYNREIINLKRVEVFERIRDLKFYDKKLFLFLEDTPSIGIVKLN